MAAYRPGTGGATEDASDEFSHAAAGADRGGNSRPDAVRPAEDDRGGAPRYAGVLRQGARRALADPDMEPVPRCCAAARRRARQAWAAARRPGRADAAEPD